ncbi:MAG: XdhC family protein, partial [Gammaproteobacteria bacterium]
SVFETGQAKMLFYDMRAPDDVVWGLGLGCNGAAKVLLQLLRAEGGFSPLPAVAAAAEAERPGVLVSVCRSDHPAFPAGFNVFFDASAIDASSPFAPNAGRVLGRREPSLESICLDGLELEVFYDPLFPPAHLLIIGAGADAVPLVRCALSLGWRVSVVDYRPGHIKPERFPKETRLLYSMPEDLIDNVPLQGFDAVVLMTHNIEYDARYLKALADSELPFIGLLGPAARRERLLAALGPSATAGAERVFGPVGLDIGARSPEEIALSVMAGIYAALNERPGGQLGRSTDVSS